MNNDNEISIDVEKIKKISIFYYLFSTNTKRAFIKSKFNK